MPSEKYEPANTLLNRTFLGLILSQFLAAFNDQAIHASAMFYAIHQHSLTEAQAISLMPILFYAPWAIFCTIAGYLADRYSKRSTLVFWKVAEVAITLVALLGFWLGTNKGYPYLGSMLVLSTVFLMGTHSSFFVPAKYGVMPEILQPHLLSKGNGVLESTSFLAIIMGTVSGGYLSGAFKGSETYIGFMLVFLAILGAAASSLIRPMPAANPNRPFPINLFAPLVHNLRTMIRSKPLALSILGIAFFTFMVAFMRATMYMHGESQNPKWDERDTSLIVATVALGVGLGSPLAGNLSGGKVELGLVPLGAVGMILASLVASIVVFKLPGLVAMLILLGFFSGFYIVPLYTLLQHRAPKASKGDLIATSNFINVTGAIAASVLFYGLVLAARVSGLTPLVDQKDNYARGTLTQLENDDRGRPILIEVTSNDDPNEKTIVKVEKRRVNMDEDDDEDVTRIVVDDGLLELVDGSAKYKVGDAVVVSTYKLHGVEHFKLRKADQELAPDYDDEAMPRYLFVGASLMTAMILYLLCRQLPDFFVRALLWVRNRGQYNLRVLGINHLPTEGPVLLATNCDRFESAIQVIAATDRFTRFVLLECAPDATKRPIIRYLSARTGLMSIQPGESNAEVWSKALSRATRGLREGNMMGITVESEFSEPRMDGLIQELRTAVHAPVLPVYCTFLSESLNGHPVARQRVQVVIGTPMAPGASLEEIRQAIRQLSEAQQQEPKDASLVEA